MNSEVKDYVLKLNVELIENRKDIQKKIFMANLPNNCIKKGSTLFDELKKIGISEELIEKYLTNGYKEIDSKLIEDNPYYKNISLKDIVYDDVQVKNTVFKENEIAICEQEYILNKVIQLPLSVIKNEYTAPVLTQDDKAWMSITHSEIITMDEHIKKAKGKVFTAGLGLGYFTYMCAIKPEVESVTIIELQQDVIDIFVKYILPQFGEFASKINIIKGNYFEYISEFNLKKLYDYSFIDIYMNQMDGIETYMSSKEIMLKNRGKGIVEFWLEKGFYNVTRDALLKAILYKRVLGQTNQECYKSASIDMFYMEQYMLLIVKAISFIENRAIRIESIEDVDALIFGENKDLYEEIAGYKHIMTGNRTNIPKKKTKEKNFERKPKVKREKDKKENNDHISTIKGKKLSRKERKLKSKK